MGTRELLWGSVFQAVARTRQRRMSMGSVTSPLPSEVSTIFSKVVTMRSMVASARALGLPVGGGAFFWARSRLSDDSDRCRSMAISVRDLPPSKCIRRTMLFSHAATRGVFATLAASMIRAVCMRRPNWLFETQAAQRCGGSARQNGPRELLR